jgi:hypothetical protein
MPDLKIKLPTPEEITRQKLDAIRHPKLRALKGKNLWPVEWAAVYDDTWTAGMRGVPRKKTLSPFNIDYREKRAKRNRIANESKRKNRS